MIRPFGVTLWPPFDFGPAPIPTPATLQPDPDETAWSLLVVDPDETVFVLS